MKDHFALYAAYNRWANQRLYAAVAAVNDNAYRADRGAFFGSLHGTLNHILVGDRLWLRRLTGKGESPGRLNSILYDDFPALRSARTAEDERIARYVDGVADFAAPIAYVSTSGESATLPVGAILTHLFNHQTHHRGQAHALLTQAGGESAALDMVVFMRERAAT